MLADGDEVELEREERHSHCSRFSYNGRVKGKIISMKWNVFLAGLLCAVMSALLPVPALAMGPDSNRVYNGIDVSVYQGEVDFKSVKDSGMEVVYIRAGEGTNYIDPYFVRNAREARRAGMHFGFYLYVTACTVEQAQEQASFFAELIREKNYDCRPVMDFEQSGYSVERINLVAQAFLERLKTLTSITPMIYTDAYAADRIWDQKLGTFPLWVADYGPAEPDVSGGGWVGWSGLQYSDRGRVSGVQRDVDLDRFTDRIFLTEEEKPEEPSTSDLEYAVRWGDTLWAIAQRYHITVDAIVQANGIADPNQIYVGQVLRIPLREAYVKHVVEREDTLWNLARKYGTTVDAIAELNKIADPSRIYVGQVIKIPIRS